MRAQERSLVRASLMVEQLANNERKLRHICLFADVLVCAKLKQPLAALPAVTAPAASHIIYNFSGDNFEIKWFIPLSELIVYKYRDNDQQTGTSIRVASSQLIYCTVLSLNSTVLITFTRTAKQMKEQRKKDIGQIKTKITQLRNEIKAELARAEELEQKLSVAVAALPPNANASNAASAAADAASAGSGGVREAQQRPLTRLLSTVFPPAAAGLHAGAGSASDLSNFTSNGVNAAANSAGSGSSSGVAGAFAGAQGPLSAPSQTQVQTPLLNSAALSTQQALASVFFLAYTVFYHVSYGTYVIVYITL